MKVPLLFLKNSIGLVLLAGMTTAFQACSSDGKKESRTEDAMEQTGDAVSADAKDAQARAKEQIRETDEKLTEKSKDAAADFRRDRDVVVANIKKEPVKWMQNLMSCRRKRNGMVMKQKPIRKTRLPSLRMNVMI